MINSTFFKIDGITKRFGGLTSVGVTNKGTHPLVNPPHQWLAFTI